MQIFTEDELKYGIEIAPGIHYKNGRFIYDNWRIYLRVHLTELAGIALGILGVGIAIVMLAVN